MNNKSTYKIALADDEKLLLKGLTMLVNEHPLLHVCWTAEDGQDLINKITNPNIAKPDLILCDLEMPNKNGVQAVTELDQLELGLKIVILSSHYDSDLILKMIEVGASAFMPKNESPEEFYLTILNVIQKDFHYNDYILQLIRDQIHFGKKKNKINLEPLTKREKEVLYLICEQLTNKEISEQLHLSIRTIEGHRNNLLSKTKSKNTAGLIIYAVENGYYQVNLKKKDW